MSVSITIVPFSETLDMYGEPDRHAAYSLSGHIQISLSSTTGFFDRRRVSSFLLQSLTVTFEGQTELISEETGYSAFRLCSVVQDLVTGEPIELSNEGHEDPAQPCTWNIVFNLTVPGWLPESSCFGEREGGTRYSLHASATIQSIEDSASGSWLSTFCSPFRSHFRVIRARRARLTLNRFMSPSERASTSSSIWPIAHYGVSPQPEHLHEGSQFPADVLSKIRVQVSIPECVGTDEGNLPFTLRLRTNDLSQSECSRLRVETFDVDLEQSERYRTIPLPAYVSQFPVPSRSQQPPFKPLLNPHPVQALYELGLTTAQPVNHVLSRTFSLLSADASGHYMISGDGYIFQQEAHNESANTWFSLSTGVSFAQTQPSKVDTDDWKRRRELRPSSQSPLLGINHRMYVTLTCTYDLTEGENPERATERLRFHVPLRFVRALPDSHPASRSPSPTVMGHSQSPSVCSTASAATVYDFSKPASPYAQSLPAYSQLFHANGDRKIDYSIPLPLYTPRPSESDLTIGGKCLPPSDASDEANLQCEA